MRQGDFLFRLKIVEKANLGELNAMLKIGLWRVISFALPAGPIFDCPKMGEKGTAHRNTVGKAAPRGICRANSGGKARGTK